MADRFVPGEQVRVDTRSGESFYGAYLRWRSTGIYEHLVRVVVHRNPLSRMKVGKEFTCTDTEVEPCPFVIRPPTLIEDIDQFLAG